MILSSIVFGDSRYAFIYSKNIDDTFINFYDKVVVDADIVDDIYAFRYPKKMVAYISIGEIEKWRKQRYKKSWIISKNRTWNSLIANISSIEYQKFLLDRADELYKRGYRNFFLDTMDAYHITSKDRKLFLKLQNGLIEFVHKLHRRYPKAKIITNRGFEILDKIHSDISAVAVESLFGKYDHNSKSYGEVSKKDREWILSNLKRVKEYGLDAISIDYSNGGERERREIAKKIRALGIIPYVTDGLLQEQGECDVKRVRRDILILFNASSFKDSNAVYSDVHLITSMPIEHYGYIPILYDISTRDLPQSVADRYHAVLIWSAGYTKNNSKIYSWVKKVKDRGIKVLFINSFVFKATEERLNEFGLKVEKNRNSLLDKGRVVYHKPYKPFEIKFPIEYKYNFINPIRGKKIITVKYKNSQIDTPIAITPWGGYAVGNSLLISVADKNFLTIDIFKFLKDTLRLNNTLVPDPTTEAGRRILFAHVDGDGFVERVRTDMKRLAPEMLIEHIYKKFKIPQSVSIIQGEVDTIGIFPKLSPYMKKIAKELYSIPWIEPASHSFSHPFFWNKAIQPQNASPKAGKNYHLNIPNYYFNLRQETVGSINFALSFAPKNRRREKILFWSGDCLPPKKVLAYIERHHILGLNGGDTTINDLEPWLDHVAPFGIQRGEYWQIYTAQQNENIYTNEWTGPFWGFRHVIETFKRTENPKRLKAMDIYYHLYSGSRVASLQALDEVYSYALTQKTSKLYASQYIRKGKGFYHTSIADLGNNRYEIRNQGYLRTVRVDKRVKVNLRESVGVAGFNYKDNTTYITLDRRDRHIIKLDSNIDTPYLIDSEGWVERVTIKQNSFKFKLKSNMDIEANFFVPNSCKLTPIGGLKSSYKGRVLSILYQKREVTIEFKCK